MWCVHTHVLNNIYNIYNFLIRTTCKSNAVPQQSGLCPAIAFLSPFQIKAVWELQRVFMRRFVSFHRKWHHNRSCTVSKGALGTKRCPEGPRSWIQSSFAWNQSSSTPANDLRGTTSGSNSGGCPLKSLYLPFFQPLPLQTSAARLLDKIQTNWNMRRKAVNLDYNVMLDATFYL